MKIRAALAFVALALLCPHACAELKIVGTTNVAAGRLVRLEASGHDPKAGLVWRVYPRQAIDRADTINTRLQFTAPAATYQVELLAIKLGADGSTVIEEASVPVTIGAGPAPVPPVPPAPVPPQPDPPSPAPIPEAGFRVLVVTETADVSKLPLAQQTALFAKVTRDYLNSHCVKGPDGKTPEWRMWDKDVDAAGESELWRKALAKSKGKPLPYVIVSNGKDGFEGPLPADVARFMILLKRFGDE